MSNLYGYTDYNGPGQAVADSDSDDDDPLRPGVWMEGDSLAPPCGTAVQAIHHILDFTSVSKDDTLYDLGCGDGRICLEAIATRNCQQCVGIEIEADLVERGNHLVSTTLTNSQQERIQIMQKDLREIVSTLVNKIGETEKEKDAHDTADNHNLPPPTVIILYLLPDAIKDLENDFLEMLRRLPRGFRIVCNTWGLPHVRAVKTTEYREENRAATTSVYLYTKDSLES